MVWREIFSFRLAPPLSSTLPPLLRTLWRVWSRITKQITIIDEDKTATCYEMKKKCVTTDDIYVCAEKITKMSEKPDNYIFITTERIDKDVKELADSFYNKLGVEIAVLDCIGFINHFLHFFYRYRTSFLDHYQQLLLEEPVSAVSQPLKEAFLNLRRVAEIREA